MKRNLLIALFTIASFVGVFFLANYLSDHKVGVHAHLSKAIYWIESLFNTEQEIQQPLVENKHVFIKPEPQYQHVEVGNIKTCKHTSLGEIKYKKTGNVYTWVDERGISNFSSTPPNNADFKQLNYAENKIFDYFSLDLNTENLPYDFNQKLSIKLHKLFELYGKLLDVSKLRKVDINLRVFASKNTFNQVKLNHKMPLKDNTLGFYSHSNNQAYLLFTTNNRTMKTAIHEATHAINRGIIGYSNNWLNEGLAEYSEYIEVVGKYGRVYPNQDWTNNNKVSAQLLPLSVLIGATHKEWNSNLKTRLYASSWAFVYFMMDNKQRKSMLSKFIKSEQQNLCNVIPKNNFEKVIGLSINNLQKQFNVWSRSKFKVHTI